MPINWIDISILIIVLINIIIGMRKGIIAGIINIIGISMAIFLAIFWFGEVGGYIAFHIHTSREVANIIGFVLIFLGICIIAKILELMLKKIFSLLFVSWIDSLGGALFGLIKGSIIVGILLVIASFLPTPAFIKEQLKDSFFANRFAVLTVMVYSFLKDWLPSSLQFNTQEFLRKYHLNLFVLKDTLKTFINI
ncbi:MAG: CvpA family protein [Candidatus Caldatribacteriota bacterium]|nr:CvpA family protein [Candidatus Caldatribacteriota bacterium]